MSSQVARAIPPMMPDESSVPEPKPNPIRLSCPVCNGILVPLPGNLAVKVLEGHLERDHWYPLELAHVEAMGQFTLHKNFAGL